jgi:arabinofuranosyltransferase
MASLANPADAARAGEGGGCPQRPRLLSRLAPWGIPLLLLAGLVVVLLRCAWVTEDAYIMFRTIDNFRHGHGLTWNITERVQVYTCPLWMFSLTSVISLTGEYYRTAIFFSLAITLVLAGLLAYRIAPTWSAGVVALCALTFSKAFVDFSTSGLENPMSHLLLVVYCLVYLRCAAAPGVRSLFVLALLAGLAMLNRLDTGLFYLPSLLWVYWHCPKVKGLLAAALGLLPVAAWEVFSLLYYGFPFPNTAYAKLNTGIPAHDYLVQGMHYYGNALVMDPPLLAVIAAGLLAPFVFRKWAEMPLALGVGLYLVYVLKIGGDFMSVRFFSAPLVLSVVLLCRCPLVRGPRCALACVAVLLALSLWSPKSPLRSGGNYGTWTPDEIDRWGIADERGFFYPVLGFLHDNRPHRYEKCLHPRVMERERDKFRGKPREVIPIYMAGMLPFKDGERLHFMDVMALGDPLLARLPSKAGPWRIGHYERFVPEGYPETLRTGRNLLADSHLAAYYDKLKLIVSGDLWSWQRLRAIWEMNTGQLDHLIDYDHYRVSGAPPGEPTTAQSE